MPGAVESGWGCILEDSYPKLVLWLSLSEVWSLFNKQGIYLNLPRGHHKQKLWNQRALLWIRLGYLTSLWFRLRRCKTTGIDQTWWHVPAILALEGWGRRITMFRARLGYTESLFQKKKKQINRYKTKEEKERKEGKEKRKRKAIPAIGCRPPYQLKTNLRFCSTWVSFFSSTDGHWTPPFTCHSYGPSQALWCSPLYPTLYLIGYVSLN